MEEREEVEVILIEVNEGVAVRWKERPWRWCMACAAGREGGRSSCGSLGEDG